MCAVHENIEPLQSGHPSYDHDLPFTDPNDHYHLSHDQRNPQDIGALLHDHEGDPAVTTLRNTNSKLRTLALPLGQTPVLLRDLIPSPPFVRPCTSFPIFGSYPVILICLPIHISFLSIALTLPYLLFPVFPSVMPVFPVLLISEVFGHLSNPSGLSLYVHNAFWNWKVLCPLFVQTSSYISSTTPVYFL